MKQMFDIGSDDLLCDNRHDGSDQERYCREAVKLGERVVLGVRGVRQLDPDRVVHGDEDEEQGVGHEVLLSVVAQKLVILAHILVHLNGRRMDRLLAHESHAKPNCDPDPEAEELEQEADQVHVLSLRWKRMALRA